MAYSADTFTSLEQPTLAKWNKLWDNDAAFNNGTGLPSAGAARGHAAAAESTTSASFVRLTTTTDYATVTIGATGMAIVSYFAIVACSNTAQYNYMCFDSTGANVISAATYSGSSYNFQTWFRGFDASYACTVGRTVLVTGLTAGSTTFRMHYAVSGGATANYRERSISVVPL